MAQQFTNNARTTLGGSGLANTATVGDTFSVTALAGALFPAGGGSDYFDVTIQDATNIEIIRVSSRTSDVFTIQERARESTTAATFASGAIVALRMTAGALQEALNNAASAITNTPAGNIAATTVQAAINELDSEKEAVGVAAAAVAAHTGDTTDAHAASAITNTPAGNIAATTVQAAINELDSEKAAASHSHTLSNISDAGTAASKNTGTTAGMVPLVGTKSATETLAGLVELANQAEAEAGTDDTVVMTPLKTAQAIAALAEGVGIGQTWTDVKTSPGRSSGTSYQNTTGAPIQVFVGCSNSGTYSQMLIEVSPDNSAWTSIGTIQNAQYYAMGSFLIVPNGWYYKFTAQSGSIGSWVELR